MNYTRTTTAALAAALILGQALPTLAETTWNDAVIFCKGRLLQNGESGDACLSVTIPVTEGATDYYGNPTTIWNIGEIMAGGVYDSFYNGGPGYFRVHNNGNLPAYVYVSTGYGDPKFRDHQAAVVNGQRQYYYQNTRQLLGFDSLFLSPVALPKFQQDYDNGYDAYAMAVSTDVTAIVPIWRPLSWFVSAESDEYVNGATALSYDWYYTFPSGTVEPETFTEGLEYTAYLAYMPIGETQLFDLKFWAPLRASSQDFWFPIRIEASAFKLWDHER